MLSTIASFGFDTFKFFLFKDTDMDIQMKQLIQIRNYIKQASISEEKGLVRLNYLMAISLLQEISTNQSILILKLESVGEQPEEILRI
ncbi:unnamed protein product [Rotaria magnacalcarata]|uniref:Uncharacterized protein n=1 Tax=Rotaria magnacalcarata TaxID=392030 RepID=A0A816ZPU0_9BILA|nr:unnamed protein product [Rotaria magnacalcarata]CAF1473164.1 unnamed protein product [Rotaria magnacalcarata]CAF2225563.1 unnamed protein product [Rotaria magnacalcarata]